MECNCASCQRAFFCLTQKGSLRFLNRRAVLLRDSSAQKVKNAQVHGALPRFSRPAHSKLSANANVSRPFHVSRRTTLQLLRFPHVQEEIEQRLHKKTQDASSI